MRWRGGDKSRWEGRISYDVMLLMIAAFFVDHFLYTCFSVVCSSVDFCHSRDGKYEAIFFLDFTAIAIFKPVDSLACLVTLVFDVYREFRRCVWKIGYFPSP